MVAVAPLLRLVIGLVLFAALHSALAADAVRAPGERRLGPRAYRLLYNLVSVLALGVIAWTSRGTYPTVWRATGAARWGLLGVQLVGVIGFVAALGGFDVGAFLGLRPPGGRHGAVREGPSSSARGARLEPRGIGMQTSGAYALCRHPLYFFSGLFFSAWPTMDLRALVFALWLWAYVWIGSILEERRLAAEFGAAYRAYQTTHRRLLPLGPRHR